MIDKRLCITCYMLAYYGQIVDEAIMTQSVYSNTNLTRHQIAVVLCVHRAIFLVFYMLNNSVAIKTENVSYSDYEQRYIGMFPRKQTRQYEFNATRDLSSPLPLQCWSGTRCILLWVIIFITAHITVSICISVKRIFKATANHDLSIF